MCLAAGVALAGQPLVITSEVLEADRKSNTALFTGSVMARNDEMTMSATSMKVFYDGAGELERIEADGAVKVVRQAQVVTSERASFDAGGRMITFTGSPKAVEGSSVLSGSKIVYYLDDDRVVVTGSRMLIEGSAGQR